MEQENKNKIITVAVCLLIVVALSASYFIFLNNYTRPGEIKIKTGQSKQRIDTSGWETLQGEELKAAKANAPLWTNAFGPYGGDRADIFIDPNNTNILFINSADNSGVWISKNGARPTGDIKNLSWKLTALDRGFTAIAGAINKNKTYVFATVSGYSQGIMRLNYSKDFQEGASDDPAIKEWERIKIFENPESGALRISTDPDSPGKVYALFGEVSPGNILDNKYPTKIFISNDYGETWNPLVSSSDQSLEKILRGRILYMGNLKSDPKNENAFVLQVIAKSDGKLINTLVGYDKETGWKLVTKIFDTALIKDFSFNKDGTKLYLLKQDFSKLGLEPMEIGIRNAKGAFDWERKQIVLEKNGEAAIVDRQIRDIRGIAVSPLDLNLIFMFIETSETPKSFVSRGMYKSENGGKTWKAVMKSSSSNMAFLKKRFYFDPLDQKIIYAGLTEKTSIMKSVDAGNSWQVATEGLSGINIFGVAQSGNRIYAVSQSAVAINQDNLKTNKWTASLVYDSFGQVTANLYGGIEIDPFEPNVILIGAGYWAKNQLSANGGIFRHNNYGIPSSEKSDWQRTLYDSIPNDGFSNPQIMDILFSDDTPGLVFATARKHQYDKKEFEYGLYVSHDQGRHWGWIYRESDMFFIAQNPYDKKEFFAVGRGINQGGKVIKITVNNVLVSAEDIVVSEDISELGQDFLYSIDIQRGKNLETAAVVIGTAAGRVIGIPLIDFEKMNFRPAKILTKFKGKAANAVAVFDPAEPESVYAGAQDGGIRRSVDNGKTWQDYSQGLRSSARDIYEIKFSPDGKRIYAGTLGAMAVLKKNLLAR